MRLGASMFALLLASGLAHATEPAAPPRPGAPPPAETGEARAGHVWLAGFAAELGGSPAVFGAKLGLGALHAGDVSREHRWMAWLEADGTDWFRPRHPPNAGRVDRLLWIYPHLELARELAHRPLLLGWVRAGPTIGRYTVAGGADTVWFPGLAVGAGVLLAPVRIGVTYYGQWMTRPFTGEPGDVRIEPLVLVTAGLEYLAPLGP